MWKIQRLGDVFDMYEMLEGKSKGWKKIFKNGNSSGGSCFSFPKIIKCEK